MMIIFPEILFQIQNLKLALLFFENFIVDFQISYFREKQLSCQMGVCFQVSTYINLNVLRNFKTFYIGPRVGQTWFKSIGLKIKDMRNDNLFFKGVADIIIADYPLSINM